MTTKAFEGVVQILFVVRALELGWQHDARNHRSHRWFYFHRRNYPTVWLHFKPDSASHLYIVGRDATNSEKQAIEFLERIQPES